MTPLRRCGTGLGENEALEFAFQNGGSTEVRVPGFRFVVGDCVVGWLSGTAGRMLLDGAAWVMLSGWCADGGNGPEGRAAGSSRRDRAGSRQKALVAVAAVPG